MALIRILNMEEYNPRKDRKKHAWFRVDNTIAFSPKLSKLDAEQRWFVIFLISLASFNQADTVDLDYDYLVEHSKVSRKKIEETLRILVARKTISIEDENDLSVTDRLPVVTSGDRLTPIDTERCPTDRQTDITDRQTPHRAPDAPVPDLDFEPIYQNHYPLKRGKDEGLNRLKTRIRDPETKALFEKAVLNYRAECVLEKCERKFIKHFSSFVGVEGKEPWRDYVDWTPPRAGFVRPQLVVAPEASAMIEKIVSICARVSSHEVEKAAGDIPPRMQAAIDFVGGWGSVYALPPDDQRKELAKGFARDQRGSA